MNWLIPTDFEKWKPIFRLGEFPQYNFLKKALLIVEINKKVFKFELTYDQFMYSEYTDFFKKAYVACLQQEPGYQFSWDFSTGVIG